ncbi:MAG: DUF3050 domain-containing protein [Cyanobacteriota bacterium]
MHPFPDHPLPRAIHGVSDLRLFMEHHVFAVWDFGCLLQALDGLLSGTSGEAARLIAQLRREEEQELLPPCFGGPRVLSHFAIYRLAMQQVGADTRPLETFLAAVERHGVAAALGPVPLPQPSRRFLEVTQAVIAGGEPQELAAALAWGRELLLPELFQALRNRLVGIAPEATLLQWYIERHIALDGEEHGPLTQRLAEGLCAGQPDRLASMRAVAERSIAARRLFWDEITAALKLSACSTGSARE